MRIKAAPADAQPYPRYAACDSIRNFGARGDGTADDAVALQKAINSVGSGCSIFFPPGVYKLDSNITINKDITLQLGPQVEIRQFARLIPSANGMWSLTVQGEGPGTSVWRQGINHPFWSGINAGPRFKNLRLINLEFKPITYPLDNPHHFGGSTDLLEIILVTISRGVSSESRRFSLRTGDSAPTTALLNVLRDVYVSGANLDLDSAGNNLQITRLTGDIPGGSAGITVLRSSGSGEFLLSSCRLRIGRISKSAVSPIVSIRASANARLSATINDLEIQTDSWDAAIHAEARTGGELLQWGRDLAVTETAGSPGLFIARCRLQWGRDLAVTETRGRRSRIQ
jgi:hypothetical protein